jgi:hypothetical protein
MRFIKHQNTNLRNVYGKGVKYDINDQVFIDSNNSVLIPKGTSAERPTNAPAVNGGHMRYNTSTDGNGSEIGFECYYEGAWRRVRFAEPSNIAPIHVQTLGYGDAIETFFGPLNNTDPDYPVPAAAENILVFVENVYQLPYTNYTLVQNPGLPNRIIVSIDSIDGVTGYPTVTTAADHGFETGDLVLVSGVETDPDDNLELLNVGDDSTSPGSVTVTKISDTQLQIHVDVTGGVPANYTANTGKIYGVGADVNTYPEGWYLEFSSPVDLNKPVTVLHNFDK